MPTPQRSPRRLYVACQVEGKQVEEKLREVRATVARAISPEALYIPEDRPHITLRFLATIDIERPYDLANAARFGLAVDHIARAFPAIPMTLGPIKSFPGVVWAEPQGTPEAMKVLTRVQELIDQTARRHWEDEPDYPFTPHITLALVSQEDSQRLEKELGQETPGIPFEITALDLIQSDMDPATGETRRTIARSPLKPRSSAGRQPQ